MITPCTIMFPFGTIEYLLAPGETTLLSSISAKTPESNHLRQTEKPYGKEVYYGGYLAGLQQELADNPMSFSFY